jgi:hypothetical protein
VSAISRRLFLSAAAALGGTTLLPRGAFGQSSAAPPKRLIVVFTPNGTIYDAWKPTGTEMQFELSRILTPLAPYKDRILILDGIELKSGRSGPGDDHMRGMGHMLTGVELSTGTTQGGGGMPAGFGGGISIDQLIAAEVGKTSRFKSLEFGAYVRDSDIWSRMIYAGKDQPLPPMEDPEKAYSRIFSTSTLDAAALARLTKRRKSVLDHAIGTLGQLANKMPAEDRVRVEAHADAVRQIEKQIVSQASACSIPKVGPLNTSQIANYEPTGRLMIDMLVASMACDQTRVASMQFSRSVSQMSFPSIGISDQHHDLSHLGDGDGDAKEKLTKINTYYANQFAYLLEKLNAVKEGDGTLLDHSLVIWLNELAKGNEHSHSPMPVVIAGKCSGSVRTGRYVTFPNSAPHNNLLTSLANAMGVPIKLFGDPKFGTGSLSEL